MLERICLATNPYFGTKIWNQYSKYSFEFQIDQV